MKNVCAVDIYSLGYMKPNGYDDFIRQWNEYLRVTQPIDRKALFGRPYKCS